MAGRAAQRIADEITGSDAFVNHQTSLFYNCLRTDIGYQAFPDISWVYNKQLRISGPRTSSDYASIEEKVLNSKIVVDSIQKIYNEKGISLTRLQREARDIFESLNTEVSSTSTRSLAYMFRKFWRSAYDGMSNDYGFNDEQ